MIRGRGATLKVALALTVLVLLVEVTGGLAARSLALLSDAGHVLTDVFALGLALFALEQSKRQGDPRRTYGYQRAGILAALVNSAVLIVIVLGIAINVFVLVMLRRHATNLNLRAAVLHVTGDVGASIGVVVAGVVILLTGWTYIDALLSLAIACLIAYGAVSIVREAVNLLMEGTPAGIDLGAVTAEINRTQHVTGVHDLHVWALSSETTALSMHVVVDDIPLGDAEHLVRNLEHKLCDRFGIGHTTIQVESCHPCGDIFHGAGEHNHPHEHQVFTSAPPARPPASGSSAPPR